MVGEVMVFVKVIVDVFRGIGLIMMEEWSSAMFTALFAVWCEFWY